MKRLTQTRLFLLLSGGKEIFSPEDTDIAPLYDDFVQSAISICTSAQGDVPAHFTLHYTRLELEAFQSRLSTEGAGKNGQVRSCVQKCICFLDISLQWIGRSSAPENRPPCYLFVQHNDGFKKITADAICYLEASSSYCELYLVDGAAMLVSIPLSEAIKLLPFDTFIRVHRSFSVNILHVDSFIGNALVMDTGVKLPIGREYRKTVIGRFTLVGTKSRKYTL